MRAFEKISYEQFEKDTGEVFTKEDYDKIQLPSRATSKSAGYDIRAARPSVIGPGKTKMIPTGCKVQMDDDDVFLIMVRSSIGIKKLCILPNSVGVIDADYYNNPDNEGHFWVALTNISDETVEFNSGDRIAQGIFVKYNTINNDDASGERKGGFGSTSK